MTTVDVTPARVEDEILALYRAHLSKGRATVAELFGSHMEVSSSGAWLRTSDGERFLNCGGYGVFIAGARHPIVMDAVQRQLAVHPIATRILLEPTVARAAQALASVLPTGLERIHFALSGAEAVETGLKLARAHGRTHLVSTWGGYHGKTLGALSVTGKEVYQKPFQPLLPQVTHIRFGDADALEEALAAHPGQSCVEYDSFLILDEVQTGLGRLGAWWGADHAGVTPDVLLIGKALGGGVMPVSAAVASRRVFAPFDKDPYIHTATFSGAPVLMAAVQGAIQAIKEERLVSRAAELGWRLLPELRRIAEDNCPDLVVEVRGQGLLIGVEMAEPGLAGELLIELFNHGIVGNHSMIGSATVRFTPPAILTDDDVEYLLDGFQRATRDLVKHQVRMPGNGS